MVADASQSNTDKNMNTGGYAGEIEASIGGIAPDFSHMFENMGASTSSATSSSSVTSSFGDINIASGKSSAGNLGTIKSLGLALLALGGFAIYSFLSGGKSSGGRK